MFYAWLVKDLLPKLPAHSVIVMDNARFHKRSDMIEAIEEQGHTLEYLPSYSPDLNPIERKWAEAKRPPSSEVQHYSILSRHQIL
ncbi:transposase [Piscirickettsia salmonis]|uniref:transposase n=1 Tax=Piscirickettsia salmonis TaxID=1238 RepID=UPI003A80D20A